MLFDTQKLASTPDVTPELKTKIEAKKSMFGLNTNTDEEEKPKKPKVSAEKRREMELLQQRIRAQYQKMREKQIKKKF